MKRMLGPMAHHSKNVFSLLFALAALLCSHSLAAAVQETGAFDDIVIALEGSANTNPTAIPPLLNQPGELILNGPTELSPDSPTPVIVSQGSGSTSVLTGPADNPFAGFEPADDSVLPGLETEHSHHPQLAAPSVETYPEQSVLSPNVAPGPNLQPLPNPLHNPLPNVVLQKPMQSENQHLRRTTDVYPTEKVLTRRATAVQPQCELERALRLQQLLVELEASLKAANRQGYIPYGGRGLERERDYRSYQRAYDRYRNDYLRSRYSGAVRYSGPVLYAPVPKQRYPSYRFSNQRPSYGGGRSLLFGLGF